MSQNDFVIANATADAVRTDLNSAFAAIASNSGGASAPSTTYPGQWWHDTGTSILKMRNAADSAWLNVGLFSGGTFVPSPGFASEAEAKAGTENTKFMTPLRVKQATFTATSAATNGYQIGGGILTQWGTQAISASSSSVTFPVAFGSVFNIQCTAFHVGAANNAITVQNSTETTTGFVAFHDASIDQFRWLAIGTPA